MIIAVIPVDSVSETIPRIKSVLPHADGIELRLDFAIKGDLDFEGLQTLRQMIPIPVIFTLRKTSEGGHWNKSESDRLDALNRLSALQPDYMDIEHDVPLSFVANLKNKRPNIKLICSRHFLHATPQHLTHVLSQMHHPSFDLYKIAAFASDTTDAFRMLAFVASHSDQHPLTGICMGENGRLTRILSKLVGNAMHYAPQSNIYTISPGQVILEQLLIYLKGSKC